MSATRPYETIRDISLSSTSSVHTLHYDQYPFIYKTVQVISSMWYLYCVLKHCIFVTYACASPEPVISRISAILRSFCRLCGTYCYQIQPDTVIKTRHRSIAIWRWHSQGMNFRKGSGFKHTLIAPYHSRSTKRNVLFKPLSNILRQRETTQLRKV